MKYLYYFVILLLLIFESKATFTQYKTCDECLKNKGNQCLNSANVQKSTCCDPKDKTTKECKATICSN